MCESVFSCLLTSSGSWAALGAGPGGYGSSWPGWSTSWVWWAHRSLPPDSPAPPWHSSPVTATDQGHTDLKRQRNKGKGRSFKHCYEMSSDAAMWRQKSACVTKPDILLGTIISPKLCSFQTLIWASPQFSGISSEFLNGLYSDGETQQWNYIIVPHWVSRNISSSRQMI